MPQKEFGVSPILFKRYVWWFSGNQNTIHGGRFLKNFAQTIKRRNHRRILLSEITLPQKTVFFLEAINVQSKRNATKALQVVDLYNEVKSEIIELLHSQYAINILDMIFTTPIFKTSDVARRFPIKNTTLYRLLNRL